MLMALSGVHHVDIGYKYKDDLRTDELAIRIHVHNKLGNRLLAGDALPKKIDGKITDVVVNTPVLQSREGKRFDVVEGGIQVHNINIHNMGTLGLILRHETGSIVGLSNHHVLVGADGRLGDAISQPWVYRPENKDIIGKVLKFNLNYDCAIVELNNKRRYDISILQLTPNLSRVIPSLSRGIAVAKSGITTGVTYGIIDGFDERGSIYISKNDVKPNPSNILSAQGDSGSVWIVDDAARNTAVGLHYRGSTDKTFAYCYDMRRVMREMSINFINP